LTSVCFAVAAVALGFGAVNWPLGKLFLGDGGAYLLGFLVGWMAILLPMRHPDEINAWATLLVCAYPVLEVAFSYRRKSKREGHHPGQPDKVHLHMLLHRRLARPLFQNGDKALQNGMTSPFLWIYAALPATWAVLFAQNTPMLMLGLVLASLVYSALYARLTQFGWCLRPLTMRQAVPAQS
jgi:UDP-N-acetylmuramyl pentapeptide phosphotransferase/UDP-N-acetylglucosamine-1-phosphate transferase